MRRSLNPRPMQFFPKDLNGVIMSWNRGAERLFGYTAEEAVGKPVTILIPTDRLTKSPSSSNRSAVVKALLSTSIAPTHTRTRHCELLARLFPLGRICPANRLSSSDEVAKSTSQLSPSATLTSSKKATRLASQSDVC